jgi:hypothetical protein
MTISKAHWDMDGETVRLSMPFSKVDQERRIVSGFATLDNVDRQADVITTEASLKAFKKFRGNIREMHQPISVGKMVNFKEDRYFDPETKSFYSGVFVSAYISKGAQNTWEKVLDGTLSGFSIGGKMNKWDEGYDKKNDKTIRIVKDYDLLELSLVDNPANQFANILFVEKVDGINIIKGQNLDIEFENVFWDKENSIIKVSSSESEESPIDGTLMENIGFVEKDDNEKLEMIKFLVDSAKGINTSKIKKGEDSMEKTTENILEKNSDVVVKTEVAPEADAEATAKVEKSHSKEDKKEKSMHYDDEDKRKKSMHEDDEDKKEKSMHEDDEDKKEKSMHEDDEDKKEKSMHEEDEEEDTMDGAKKGKDYMKSESTKEKKVSKSDEVIANAVTDIKDTLTSAFSDLTETVKSLHEQVLELSKSLGLVKSELSSVKGELNQAQVEFDNFGKRVDAVEADTAFRKSGDLGEIVQVQPEKVEKSLWGGRFLKTADLFR